MLQTETSHLWKMRYAIILLGWRYIKKLKRYLYFLNEKNEQNEWTFIHSKKVKITPIDERISFSKKEISLFREWETYHPTLKSITQSTLNRMEIHSFWSEFIPKDWKYLQWSWIFTPKEWVSFQRVNLHWSYSPLFWELNALNDTGQHFLEWRSF